MYCLHPCRLGTAITDFAARPGLLSKAWLAFIVVESFLFLLLSASSTRQSAQPADALRPWNFASVVDPKKVAWLIGTNISSLYGPVLLQYLSTLPHEWKFIFSGSASTVAYIHSIPAIKQYIDAGKIQTMLIPGNVTISSQDSLSQFLTERWTYEQYLAPAEHVLVFQTDSIMCANSERSVNDYLSWSWIGAPWPGRVYGGNGGMSLRKVSSLLTLLKQRTRTPKTGGPEDLWLVSNLLEVGVEDIAPQNIAKYWGVELVYAKNPMSYHTGGNGRFLHAGQFAASHKEEIYDWCPEIKMHAPMDIKEFIPGDCEPGWA